MENLSIVNTTSFVLLNGGQANGKKISRTSASRKIKLRPESEKAIESNIMKFPSTKEEEVQTVVSEETPSTNTVVAQDTPSEVKSVELPSADVPVTPSVSQDQPAVHEGVGSVRKAEIANVTFRLIPEKVDVVSSTLPKGLKVKVAKEQIMVQRAPEPTPIVVEEPPVVVDDMPTEQLSLEEIQAEGQQMVETPENVVEPVEETIDTAVVDQSDTTGLYGTMSLDGVLSVGDTSKDSSKVEEVKEEVTPEVVTPVVEPPKETVLEEDIQDSVIEEIPLEESPVSEIKDTTSSEELVEVQKEQDTLDSEKKVTPVYELCEAVDAQRLKTKEALEKVNRLTQDFQNYKEEAQKKIDASNREVKEAGDDQTEAERRYQTAEQMNQAALKNLIDTGKSQQRVLQQRQRDAEAQGKKIAQERKELEDSNQLLLARNEEKKQQHMSRIRELDAQTQLKNEEAAKWDAIARAMQDPEEDLMGFINPEDLYESTDIQQKSYGRRAA